MQPQHCATNTASTCSQSRKYHTRKHYFKYELSGGASDHITYFSTTTVVSAAAARSSTALAAIPAPVAAVVASAAIVASVSVVGRHRCGLIFGAKTFPCVRNKEALRWFGVWSLERSAKRADR